MSQTEKAAEQTGRRFTAKQLLAVAIVVAVLTGVAAASITYTVTTSVTVKEPLAITSAQPLDVTNPTLTGTCTVGTDGLTAACTILVFPNDAGTITVVLHNASAGPIPITVSSDNTGARDLTVTNPTVSSAGSGSNSLVWGYTVSSSAPATGSGTPETLTITIAR